MIEEKIIIFIVSMIHVLLLSCTLCLSIVFLVDKQIKPVSINTDKLARKTSNLLIRERECITARNKQIRRSREEGLSYKRHVLLGD